MRLRRMADRGSVLLETALAIPILLAVTVALVWVASLGAAYVRALDVAQTAARQAARGVTMPAVEGLSVSVDGGLARAVVVQPMSAPVPMLGGMTIDVTAEATALVESVTVP